MSYMQTAFEAACKEARQPEQWHVCLMQNRPYYGGPEEGGWWGTDTILLAYKAFPTREQAEAACEAARALAVELEAESRRAYGEQCLGQLKWLDDRGLEADWLPEDDGPCDYYVTVCDQVPTNSYGCRRYS